MPETKMSAHKVLITVCAALLAFQGMGGCEMMLAGRVGMWADSGPKGPTARDYVRDGLVFQLDSIEAGGFGISLSDGTHSAAEWKPLVGVGWVNTWNSQMMVDGAKITNYASSHVYYTANLGRPITIEHYCQRAARNGYWANASNYSWFALGNISYVRALNAVESPKGCGQFAKAPTEHIWRLVYDGDKIYLSNDDGSNEVKVPSDCIKGGPNSDADVSTYTQFGGGTATTVSRMPYAFRVYNRVLTHDEMAYNWELDKLRFNLA